MKLFFALLAVFFVGALTAIAIPYRGRAIKCSATYQDAMDSLAMQSQAVMGDKRNSCFSSYDMLTDWDLCLTDAQKPIDARIRPLIVRLVSNYMAFFQEQKKDIIVMEREHDERCKSYSDMIFFPPGE